MELNLSVYLRDRLSPQHISVLLTTYRDVNNAIFNGMWYQQTLAALDHAIFDIKNTTPSINLIRILMEMPNQDRLDVFKGVYAVCCAFSVPLYHVLGHFNDERIAKRFLSTITIRYTSDTASQSQQKEKLLLHTGFGLLKKVIERSSLYRYAYEVYCMVRNLTREFTIKIILEAPSKNWTDQLTEVLWSVVNRLVMLIEDVFGPKYEELFGSAIVPVVLNAYLVVQDHDCVPVMYKIHTCRVKKEANRKRVSKLVESYKHNKSPVDNLWWFLGGSYQPQFLSTTADESRVDPKFKCTTLTFPQHKATLHANVQVAHLKVLSREHMRHCVLGKSLARTVFKKKD